MDDKPKRDIKPLYRSKSPPSFISKEERARRDAESEQLDAERRARRAAAQEQLQRFLAGEDPPEDCERTEDGIPIIRLD